jgi:isopropylmalate/homocitrate/citramalate synthase
MNGFAKKRGPVSVREVGPRDGLQMVKEVMPTESKLRWISAMVRAGARQIEVGSFVPATLLPQMADTAAVVHKVRDSHPKLYATVLAPNLRGAQDAVAAGAQSIIVPVSASEAHSRANVRRSREEQVLQFGKVAEWIHSLGSGKPRIEAAVSTAFGCSMQGNVPEEEVVHMTGQLARLGADIVTLSDTLGYATPSQVRRLVRAVRSEIGPDRFGALHLHDTLGTALANVAAGLEEGVRAFDGALGGLGGCPFAPGSVGNVATEDLVYLLESEGYDTGIDLEGLLEARAVLREVLPNERLHGRVAAAGVPPTFRLSVD